MLALFWLHGSLINVIEINLLIKILYRYLSNQFRVSYLGFKIRYENKSKVFKLRNSANSFSIAKMFQLVRFVLTAALLYGLTGAKDISGKIVGGEQAPPGQAPFLVSLRVVPPHPVEYHFCGGNILNSRWLLTAG